MQAVLSKFLVIARWSLLGCLSTPVLAQANADTNAPTPREQFAQCVVDLQQQAKSVGVSQRVTDNVLGLSLIHI